MLLFLQVLFVANAINDGTEWGPGDSRKVGSIALAEVGEVNALSLVVWPENMETGRQPFLQSPECAARQHTTFLGLSAHTMHLDLKFHLYR